MIILIVEDEPSVAGLWERFLSPIEGEFRFAVSLEEANQQMDILPPPDLILLDLRMPGSTPQEVIQGIERLKERNPRAVVIIVTGLADESMPVLAAKFGADGYERKTEVTSQNLLLTAVRNAYVRNQQKTPGEPYFERNLALMEKLTSLVTSPDNPAIPEKS